MANKTYEKKVVFTSFHFRKEVSIKLQRRTEPVWTPLRVTDKKTRSLILCLFLEDGSEFPSALVLSVPLSPELSSDVNDYTCEALFQDCRDGKEIISSAKQNSHVKTFSLDVAHIPPSTYTVTDLNQSNVEKMPTSSKASLSSRFSYSVHHIEEGLRKLGLSSTLPTQAEREKTLPTTASSKMCKTGLPLSGLPGNHRQNNALEYLSIVFLKDTETGSIYLFTTTNSQFTIPFQLRPISVYELMAFQGRPLQQYCFLISAVAFCSFRTYMTRHEVSLLYNKACSFMCPTGIDQAINYVQVSHLYRNKPILHFLNIYNNTGGIMYKYLKNFGGDPSSTLNRKLHGLFFSANVDPATGLPPPVSFYGDHRIHIPVSLMINSTTNLYFADFYCHYTNHHVTLVVTLRGSEADLFCQKRLISLDPNFNVFLFRRPFDLHAMVNTRVTVEVFYTESIDIVALLRSRSAFVTSVPQTGNATLKTIVGLPKRKDCKICNLKNNL